MRRAQAAEDAESCTDGCRVEWLDMERLEMPRAVIVHPEAEEAMLSESGSLLINVRLYSWTHGVMTVFVNSTLVSRLAIIWRRVPCMTAFSRGLRR